MPVRHPDGYCFNRCPHLVARQSGLYEYMRAYLWLDHSGKMPYGGDLRNQPEKYVVAMEIILSEVRAIERESIEESRRKNQAANVPGKKFRGR